jgi:hypothetical protein
LFGSSGALASPDSMTTGKCHLLRRDQLGTMSLSTIVEEQTLCTIVCFI